MTAQANSVFEDTAIERLLPALLSGIAGMVDVMSWMTLGGLFTAHITGNLVLVAAYAVEGHAMRAAQVLAVPMFILAAAAMSIIVNFLDLTNRQREDVLLSVQTVLLVMAAGLAVSAPDFARSTSWSAGFVAMLAVSAMACQNALLRLSRSHAPTTAVMTGNIVSGTLALVTLAWFPHGDRDAARVQWRETWPILTGFLAGCIVGAAAILLFHRAGWLSAPAASAMLWTYRARLDRRFVGAD